MRIHPLSDLHNEFAPFTPEVRDADVVILAGDIDLGVRGIEWARQAFDCPVLYVPGNHEFYRGHLAKTLQAMRAAGDERVHVLDRDEVVIGGVRFLGATMWTDFAATGNTLRSLEESPHAGTILDAAFANHWEDLMGADRVALRVHGHTHTSVDFEVAGTRVVSNQRGYPGEESGFRPRLVIECESPSASTPR